MASDRKPRLRLQHIRTRPGHGCHAPNAYVNGNVFTYNVVGTNNLSGLDGTDTVSAGATTGILIWSVTKYHMVVAHNKIFANTYGIWYTPGTVRLSGLHTNRFYAVTTPIFLEP